MNQIINAKACLSWLAHLNTEHHAVSILGPLTQRIARAAATYELKKGTIAYGAEAKLLGEPGIDLSVQYYAEDFLQENPLLNPYARIEGEHFCSYANALQQLLPHVVKRCKLYFEADTFTGTQNADYAAFYSIAGIAADQLLPQLLKEHHEEAKLPAIEKCRKLAAPDMELWLVGFMNSRQQHPLRLVFIASQSNAASLLNALAKLFPALPADMATKLQLLDELQLFTFMLNIDIMPDGSLGSSLGIDLVLKTLQPSEQKQIAHSKAFKQFIKLLQDWQIADSRVNDLDKCIQVLQLKDPNLTYQLYSVYSHFKLTWKQGQLAPAKCYLGLKIQPM